MKILFYGVSKHARKCHGLFEFLTNRGHSVETIRRGIPSLEGIGHVIIFNGNLLRQRQLARRCRRRGIPVSYIEVGFFPQRDFIMLSRRGSVGGSLFRDEVIPPLPPDGEARLAEVLAAHCSGIWYPRKGYVCAMLQLPKDTAIRRHSPIRSMQLFAQMVSEAFPDDEIVFRAHPKQRAVKLETNWPVIRRGDLWKQIQEARLVVGINSTTLYQSILAGTPVQAWGRCPLQRHPDQHREIVHEIVMRQIPRGTADIEAQVIRSVGDVF